MSVDIEGKEPSSTSNLINNHEFLAIDQGKEMKGKRKMDDFNPSSKPNYI
jgi:hypothetical protein